MKIKKYKLEITRNQFDRIGDAFESKVIDVNGYDVYKDTVTFSITEKQRLWFAKYALKKDNPEIPKKLRATIGFVKCSYQTKLRNIESNEN